MTKIDRTLNADRVRFLFNYEPSTGRLTWRNPSSHRIAAGEIAGATATNGRRYVGIDGVRYLVHRVVWLHVHGSLSETDDIAAKNGDYQDLKLDNLQLQTKAETVVRGRMKSSNTSGFRGVCWAEEKGKWKAEFTRDYRKVHLGYFDTKEEAHDAYVNAMRMRTVKPLDAEDRRKVFREKMLSSRVRRLWQRTLRDYDGIVGWMDYAHFDRTVRDEIEPNKKVVARNADQLIGPSNYKWIDNASFDFQTGSGRLEYQRHYRTHYSERAKDSDLRKSFGIGLEQYREMLEAQNHVCAICGKPEVEHRRGKLLGLAVDHCHKTGAIRGLLCVACNAGIARFKDDPDVMVKAAKYVRHHAAKSQQDHPAYAFQSKDREKER